MKSLLHQKRILVTGASRGIGQAIALDLARHGAHVAVLATKLGNLEQTCSEIMAAGGESLPLEGNVAEPETAQQAVATMLETWGGVDGLVANAGITRDNLLLRMQAQEFEEVLQVNLQGSFHLLKAVTKPMMKQREGSVVFMGSVVASTGNPGQTNYCAAKAGLHGLARSAALELGSRGIRVNVVAPGFIESDMTAELPSEAQQAMLQKIALKRPGTGQDVAGLTRFLLSPESAYITGQVMLVDGGLSLG